MKKMRAIILAIAGIVLAIALASASAQEPNCGNLIFEPDLGEECDDGNTTPGDGCSENCLVEACGDGKVDVGEECDDGNTFPGDGCSFQCLFEVCGNGIPEPPEDCDDGNLVNGDGCSANCKDELVCGNGIFEPEIGEECDDGNGVPGDGCDPFCKIEEGSEPHCGNLIFEPALGEECDDGNTTPGDGCSENCLVEACGDGKVDVGEECDDGNTTPGDGCSFQCLFEACGNGIPDPGEDCDDGNLVSGDGCDAACQDEGVFAVCGDGTVEGGEDCDDGNLVNGDGCSANCTIEASIGGNVNGLDGSGLVLVNTTSSFFDQLTIDGNGSFTFAKTMNVGNDYNVEVDTNPANPAQDCFVDRGSGEVPPEGVTNIAVLCADSQGPPAQVTISGNVNGLVGSGLVLQLNPGSTSFDQLTIDANGSFTFANTLAEGEDYEVVVDELPENPAQECFAFRGEGIAPPEGITNIVVICADLGPFCSDGVVNQSTEECDDGNRVDGDGCSSTCTIEICGDGLVDAGEECDDGNIVDGDGCSANCEFELQVIDTCDEGIIAGTEADPLEVDGIVLVGQSCFIHNVIVHGHVRVENSENLIMFNNEVHGRLLVRGSVAANILGNTVGRNLVVRQNMRALVSFNEISGSALVNANADADVIKNIVDLDLICRRNTSLNSVLNEVAGLERCP
jgi:cysteine-rich repeat protein